jgi:cytochrome c551/c552
MSRSTSGTPPRGLWMALASVALLMASAAFAQGKYPGIGRAATAAEVKAWDIDVRPDFKGLPKGAGSVRQGQQVWDAKCANCHGTFGESNEVFTPIVGGTTPEDIKTGRVKALISGDYPQRTTLMKLSSLSSLWDYVNRAMPWNAPKSLSTDEVYAVVAYILHLGDILPADFTLSDANIGEAQNRLPNRNGTTRLHGLWDVKGKPDVQNTACMKDCATEIRLASSLPDHARNAHGNLAEQNRLVGQARGTDTVGGKPAQVKTPETKAAKADPKSLAQQQGCLACHGLANKVVGPSFKDVAMRYKGQGQAARLADKIRQGGSGTWGQIPMPPQPTLKDDDLKLLAEWILGQS